MKCPIDSSELLMTERQGIEVDYCPTCRGVWLDRGELDKLIDRGASQPASASELPREPYRPDEYRPHSKHRREGFLGEIFDF